MYVVLDNDNDNHISNQRNTDQESDDEVIEEIMQDGLRHAKWQERGLNGKNFYKYIYACTIYMSIILF